ncbi:MAG TPA: hypothetical protein VN703_02320 [Candidatus Sulfopaludibacter sp.]|nr:hypothetical protein [Candidatus Sulfopaludibacter sp.]
MVDGLYDKDLKAKKYLFLTFTLIDIIFLLLLLFIPNSLFHKAFATSPAFDEVLIPDKKISNQKNDWVQTYGNDSTHLKSDYADILAVGYSSDGKTLDTIFWLASNSENASIYKQPLKDIRYGMLIAIVTLPENSGYNGANYNFYVEEVNGKWSEYLYELSSTGAHALIYSKINYTQSFGGPTLGPGYVKLRLNLDSIHSPGNYGLSFYTAESLKSNEVRDFTSWVAVPPATINTITDPKNIVLKQGEEQLIPSKIETPLSDNVTSISFDKNIDYRSIGLNVSAERIQPPVFKIKVSPQTPVGVYTIPFMTSLLIQTTSSKLPKFNDTVTGSVDPEFKVSKKYPTIGYIDGKANLTIHVIPPLTINETFMAFWNTYQNAILIVAGGVVGAFSTLLADYLRSRREHK